MKEIGLLVFIVVFLFSDISYAERYDLSRVMGIQMVGDQRVKDLLEKNGFAVVPSREFNDIGEFYEHCKINNIPIFVTTDAILHTSHILFDYMLRIAEIEKLGADLSVLTQTMVDTSLRHYEQAQDPKVKEAALKNVAFFSVALKLLDESRPISGLVRHEVNAEVMLIKAHKGWSPSPIFEDPESKYRYRDEYSQYVPRGHYTRSKEFKEYFLAMMWYGRMIFPLPRDKSWEIDEFLRRVTRQALLVTYALNSKEVEGESAFKIWERIYEPTAFFVEKIDDLNIYDYTKLMERVYGEISSIENFADDAKIMTFISKGMKLREPRIESGIMWTTVPRPDQFYKRGFKFMGQRYVPDSYMFQQLVYPKVGGRYLPKGLDIMAALGSEMAEDILEKEKDFSYEGYKEQLEKLKQEFSELSLEEWAKTLYWGWLYSLQPLLKSRGEEYPLFMRNDAWTKKALNTALSSWAELRHDTILYVKQTYTPRGIPPFTKGYVELYPSVYQRIANLVRQTAEGLASRELLIDESKSKLTKFENLLIDLKRMSERELMGEPLTEEEHRIIWDIGATLSDITHFSKPLMEEIASAPDTRMMVVADVHTDANTEQVLEEGIGYPFIIYVIAPIEEELILTQGAVFSYYEFPWPMDDRLTDEKWQQMLEARGEPSLSKWTKNFVVQ